METRFCQFDYKDQILYPAALTLNSRTGLFVNKPAIKRFRLSRQSAYFKWARGQLPTDCANCYVFIFKSGKNGHSSMVRYRIAKRSKQLHTKTATIDHGKTAVLQKQKPNGKLSF